MEEQQLAPPTAIGCAESEELAAEDAAALAPTSACACSPQRASALKAPPWTKRRWIQERFSLHGLYGALALWATFLVSMGVLALGLRGDEGYWGPSSRSARTAYCEKPIEGNFARTFWNSWSNSVLSAAGGWSLGRAVYGGPPGTPGVWCMAHRALLAFWAVSLFLMGVSSFLYHASLQGWAQQLDVGAMYWVMNAGIVATLWHWMAVGLPGLAPKSAVAVSPLLVAALVADFFMWYHKWDMDAAVVFPTQLGAVLLSEALLCALLRKLPAAMLLQRAWLAAGALVLGGAGTLLRSIELTEKEEGGGVFCAPDSNFQPHAVWHVLCGFAVTMLVDIQLGPTALPV